MKYWPMIFMLPCVFALAADQPRDDSSSVISCEYSLRHPNRTGDATIKLVNGEIKSFEYSGFQSNRTKGNLGYTCGWSGDRDSQLLDSGLSNTWTTSDGVIRVSYKIPDEAEEISSVVVTRDRTGISIDFTNVRHSLACGAGSDLPRKLLVKYSSKRCAVSFLFNGQE